MRAARDAGLWDPLPDRPRRFFVVDQQLRVLDGPFGCVEEAAGRCREDHGEYLRAREGRAGEAPLELLSVEERQRVQQLRDAA